MAKKALLVIDVQNALVMDRPYACDEVIANIKTLISACRVHHTEVIYIQHTKEHGDFKMNTESWNIYHEIAPQKNEKVIRKNYNSAFRGTKLKAYLEEQGIDTLIITGMQTDYCIDTSIKVAFEYGFDLIIPERTNTTFDNALFKAEQIYNHYNTIIFKNRFGVVEPVDKTLMRITEHEVIE